MDIPINVITFARVLLALASLQLLYFHFAAANPINHELVKRANINCVPKPPGTELIFEDCVSAIYSMVAGKTPAQRNAHQYFGPGMSADVQFQILSWASGMVDWHTNSVSVRNVAYSK